jgi:hypothetical protein
MNWTAKETDSILGRDKKILLFSIVSLSLLSNEHREILAWG